MYGKLINGELKTAPVKLIENGLVTYSPSEEMYLRHGWFPVIFTEQPEADPGYYYISSWEEQNNSIIQVWERVIIPDLTAEEIVNILTGEQT